MAAEPSRSLPIFAFGREGHDMVRAVAVGNRFVRQETLLAELAPVAMRHVTAVPVVVEVFR